MQNHNLNNKLNILFLKLNYKKEHFVIYIILFYAFIINTIQVKQLKFTY